MTDEQTAAAAAELYASIRFSSSHSANIAAIVRALQAARESAIDTHANAAMVKMCREAHLFNGIVDYTETNDTGKVRQVLRVVHIGEYPSDQLDRITDVLDTGQVVIICEAAEAAKEEKK